MAEIILSPLIQILIEKLTSAAFKKLTRRSEVHSQLKKLERWLPQIQDVLFDAGRTTVTEKSVERWLHELRDLAYDIDDVLDELATDSMHDELSKKSGASTSKVRKFLHTCFTSSPQMNDKLNSITTKLQDLVEQKNTLGLKIVKAEESKNTSRRLESTSLVDVHGIVGREGDKETLLQKLLGDEPCDQNFSIVPIFGMGGIGKTTIAGSLYDDKQVKDHFKLKAWVCVSDAFDISKISKIIFASVAGENEEFPSLDLLQMALREKLLEKRFLIVLDDVWTESHSAWELLVRPFHAGARRSKIIITTRNMHLLTKLGCNQPSVLKSLSVDEALSLLSRHALGENNFDLHPTLKPHGEGIVEKCDGLPLALIALGRLLRTKTKEEEWKQVLNSEIWKLRNENEIIPALRLSYLDLPADLKQLFAYCSLFPKDYVFDKDELILLWMAEGFLQTESLGREYFEELFSRSFFQLAPNEESSYKMHDLMNDLATSVAGDILFRLDYEIEEADVKKKSLEKCRHMSFTSQTYTTRGKLKVLETAKSLRTFLAVSNEMKSRFSRFSMSNQILVDLLPELSLLRVLSLSEYTISEVPESIGSLKHLRYLNLSRTQITRLPEQVGNLYNLQTLLVYGCNRLAELPSNFSKLKNLRHLDVSDTPFLKKMPAGIGELKNLQTLSKVIIEGGNGSALTELKDINDLHGRISIEGLDKVKNAMDAKNANLSKKKLNELDMEWSYEFDGARNETLEKEVLSMLMPQKDKLRKLRIVWYGGMEFPSWVGDRSFSRLEHVTICGCKKCTSLPPLGHLTLLKELFVEAMNGVKVVGSEFGNGNCCGGVAFPSLELLSFSDMQGLEEWSTKHEDIGTAFPCLRKLRINRCHKLVHASLEAFPSLLVLEIFTCPDGVVKSVVRAASSITKLKIINISGLTQLSGGVMEYLGAVEEVKIVGCDEVRYLWESEAEACNILVNLRKLGISSCKNLVRLGMKEEDNNWRCLRQMDISLCDSLACYNCPNGMETLNIVGCWSITYVSFPRGGQKLKRLDISGCEKLLVEESGGEKSMVLLNSSMSLLQYVHIYGWPNLKSFPDLSSFTHLTLLSITSCYNLESFPDEALTKLTSLTEMSILDCRSMDDSFPRGNWPPNLTSLHIGGLKNPISEWGPQNFPTSLVHLSLYENSSSEDLGCGTSQLSSLLPSSLTNLDISGFEKLETLSMAFQHLTSLQRLHIHNSPNLIDLPETPLPSLSSLFIDDCPKISRLPVTLLPSILELGIKRCPELKERYSRRGSYWPHISHIPRIKIDYHIIFF